MVSSREHFGLGVFNLLLTSVLNHALRYPDLGGVTAIQVHSLGRPATNHKDLDRAKMSNIEAMILKLQFGWIGHMTG